MKDRGTNKDERRLRRSYRLTPGGLEALRAAVHRTKPWLKATGPSSSAGKRRASRNALRHGLYSADAVRERRQATALFRELRHQEPVAAKLGPPPQGGPLTTFHQ